MTAIEEVVIIIPTLLKEPGILKSLIVDIVENISSCRFKYKFNIYIVINKLLDDVSKNLVYEIEKLIKTYQETQMLSFNVIEPKTNLGYAGSIYYIWNKTKNTANYYVILNDDISIPTKSLICNLLSTLKSRDDLIAVSPTIINAKRNIYDYANGSGYYIDVLLTPYSNSRLYELVLPLREAYRNGYVESFAPSGAFYVAKNTKEAIPSYILFLMHEEMDIGLKICCTRKKILYLNEYVLHYGSATLKSIYNPIRMYFVYKNRYIILYSYSSLYKFFILFPIFLFHDILSSLYLINRNKSMPYVVLYAIYRFLSNIKKYTFYKNKYLSKYSKCFDKCINTGKITKIPIVYYYVLFKIIYGKSLYRLKYE